MRGRREKYGKGVRRGGEGERREREKQWIERRKT